MPRVHAAVLPSRGAGHVNPMLELCRRIVHCGFSVSFLVPENCPYIPTSEEQQEGESFHLVFFSMPKEEIPNNNMFMSPEMLHFVKPALEALEPPAQVLISSAFMGWSQDLADSLGIPRVALWPSNAANEVIATYLPRLIVERYVLPAQEDGDCKDDEKLITFIPGLPPLRPTQLPVCYQNDSIDARMQAAAIARLPQAVCVLVNTIEELEIEVVRARQQTLRSYLPVGPLIRQKPIVNHRYKREAAACMEWLEKQAPHSVLYIAFGSVFGLAVEEVAKIADAVEETSQPVLWAMRRNFATNAPGGFFEELAARIAGGWRGLLVEWAPQQLILPHSSVGAFLTHCGWNSTLEALAAGVPTLCWPLAAEQNWNAMVLTEEWKIGVNVSGGEIAGAIRAVMSDEIGSGMRARARSLRESICDGGSSARNLHSFALALKAERENEKP
ncbi:anthocyanidin 3-O-glucosyltransferase 7 [Selaginella moellendorffii]|nr:anthocyanidin 3-O-glucosyltransferase 7 [Selaginella moellendorffii]|eukprot:XP_002987151.2 anthocyanidin 3-O-glucosyltransferase 7 [Selaginella moellendorffii]